MGRPGAGTDWLIVQRQLCVFLGLTVSAAHAPSISTRHLQTLLLGLETPHSFCHEVARPFTLKRGGRERGLHILASCTARMGEDVHQVPSSLRVLAADDDEFVRSIMEQMLIGYNHTVSTASSGMECLAKLTVEAWEEEQFDVVRHAIAHPCNHAYRVVWPNSTNRKASCGTSTEFQSCVYEASVRALR